MFANNASGQSGRLKAARIFALKSPFLGRFSPLSKLKSLPRSISKKGPAKPSESAAERRNTSDPPRAVAGEAAPARPARRRSGSVESKPDGARSVGRGTGRRSMGRRRRPEPEPTEPYERRTEEQLAEEGARAMEESAGVRHPMVLNPRKLDGDAAKVVRRLTRHGFEAYLVGGCVRDLLLGQTPKDFDVATSARPEDVQELFRNCRIIGRRFRLAHVFFTGGKVVETATFRRNPTAAEKSDDELLIRRDNFFGTASEDAQRRDFAINALFYDLETEEVLDWCGGLEDLRNRSLRTIGEPIVRFLEDPVRMLRAIRFSARLDLGMTPDLYHALVQCRSALSLAAKPRLFEEILKLMRAGCAQTSLWIAWETGILDVLLPEVSTYLYDLPEEDGTFWKMLRTLDKLGKERNEPLDDCVLWSCLLFEPLLEACLGEADSSGAALDFLDPLVERLSMPRRIADAVRRIVAALPRLSIDKPGRFANSSLFRLASDTFEILEPNHPKLEAFVDAAPRKKRRRKPATGR